jgi:hypothetical protein
MTNVEGRKPEGAPERFLKAGEGAASGVDGNVAKRFSVQRKRRWPLHGCRRPHQTEQLIPQLII